MSIDLRNAEQCSLPNQLDLCQLQLSLQIALIVGNHINPLPLCRNSGPLLHGCPHIPNGLLHQGSWRAAL